MASSSSTSVSQTLSSIFADMPCERLSRHLSPPPSSTAVVAKDKHTEQRNTKRAKLEPPQQRQQPLYPELIQLVAEFLDPFEVQAWSCCNKATHKACTLQLKLNGVFSYFRILKAYADEVADAQYDWSVVMNVMLEALKELRGIYGPYHVHPLHAAIVGELLFIVLARRGPNQPTALEDAFDSVFSRGSCFVLGDHGDYFAEDEGIEAFRGFVQNNAKQFPAGPARVLAEEKRIPFVNFFCLEAEEHTEQVGISFPNNDVSKTNNSEKVPAHVFCMNCQDLPDDDDVNWYQGLECYYGCKTIEQAFCQYIPLRATRHSVCDNWTQLLRAAWLKAHQLAPFDATNQGKMRWDRVIESVGPELNDTGDAAEMVHVLDLLAEDDPKDYATHFLRQNHELAKGSDYH